MLLNPAYAPALFNAARLTHESAPLDAQKAQWDRFLAVSTPGKQANIASKRLSEISLLEAAEVARTQRLARVDAPAPPTNRVDVVPPPPPPTAEELLGRARIAVAGEAYDEALEMLKRARETDPKSADVLWELAGLWEQKLGNEDEAEELYGSFISAFPDDSRTKKRLADIALATLGADTTDAGSDPDAAGNVTQAGPKEEAMAIWSRGLKEHRAGNVDAAIASYKKAFQLDDTLVSASYNLGLAYRAKGDPARARDAFLATISLKPDMLDARYMLAVTLHTLQRPQEAIVELKKVLRIDPRYSKAHLLLGIVYRERGRPDLARQHFTEFVRIDPQNPLVPKVKRWLAGTG